MCGTVPSFLQVMVGKMQTKVKLSEVSPPGVAPETSLKVGLFQRAAQKTQSKKAGKSAKRAKSAAEQPSEALGTFDSKIGPAAMKYGAANRAKAQVAAKKKRQSSNDGASGLQSLVSRRSSPSGNAGFKGASTGTANSITSPRGDNLEYGDLPPMEYGASTRAKNAAKKRKTKSSLKSDSKKSNRKPSGNQFEGLRGLKDLL